MGHFLFSSFASDTSALTQQELHELSAWCCQLLGRNRLPSGVGRGPSDLKDGVRMVQKQFICLLAGIPHLTATFKFLFSFFQKVMHLHSSECKEPRRVHDENSPFCPVPSPQQPVPGAVATVVRLCLLKLGCACQAGADAGVNAACPTMTCGVPCFSSFKNGHFTVFQKVPPDPLRLRTHGSHALGPLQSFWDT